MSDAKKMWKKIKLNSLYGELNSNTFRMHDENVGIILAPSGKGKPILLHKEIMKRVLKEKNKDI